MIPAMTNENALKELFREILDNTKTVSQNWISISEECPSSVSNLLERISANIKTNQLFIQRKTI